MQTLIAPEEHCQLHCMHASDKNKHLQKEEIICTWHLLEVLQPETAFLQHLAGGWSSLQVCQHIGRTQTSQNCCAHHCLANLYPTATTSSESLLRCSLGCTLVKTPCLMLLDVLAQILSMNVLCLPWQIFVTFGLCSKLLWRCHTSQTAKQHKVWFLVGWYWGLYTVL